MLGFDIALKASYLQENAHEFAARRNATFAPLSNLGSILEPLHVEAELARRFAQGQSLYNLF